MVTAVFATLFGLLVAVTVVRHRFPGRALLDAFFMSPLVLPTLVIGLALLQYYSLAGVGASYAGVVIGHVVITTPYATRLIMASLTGVDHATEWAAQTLGASKVGAFVRVTFPVIRNGMVSGAIFTFIMSFENVIVYRQIRDRGRESVRVPKSHCSTYVISILHRVLNRS